jgi:hypothetical protein
LRRLGPAEQLTKLRAVLGVDTSAVDDSGSVSDGLGDLVSEPFADIGVNLLRLLDGSDLAGTDSPDWLVYGSVLVSESTFAHIQAITTFLHNISSPQQYIQTNGRAGAARLTSNPPP